MLQVRKLVLAIAAVTTLSSGSVFALGLGEIKVNSKLNQPLNAEIELLDTKGLTATELKPALASPEDFTMAGVERNYYLTSLKFTPIVKNGKSYVRVTTQKPVNEPYLNFVMEMIWPDGKLLREYTLLLDPPNYEPQRIVYAPAVAPQVAPVTVSTTPSPKVETAPSTPTAPATTKEQPAVAANAPKVAPTQPVSKPLPASSVQQAKAEKPAAQPAEKANTQPALQAGEYKVKKNDTLWDIANEVSGGRNVNQTMLALQDLNPKAFINGNINQLREGYNLRTPSEQEVRSRTRAQAIAEVANQNSAWRDGTSQPQLNASRTTQAGNAPAKVDNQDKMRLVASAGKSEQGQDKGSSASRAQTAQIAQLKENIDSIKLENADLQSRVSDLSTQLDKANRLVEMKSAELAMLQEQLDQQSKAPVAPAPVDTSATTEQPGTAAATTPEVPAVTAPSVTEPVTAGLPDVTPDVQPEPTLPAVKSEPEVAPVTTTQAPAPALDDSPVYVDESSLLDDLLGNPTLLAAVGGGVVLLLLLLVLMRRRAAQKKADAEIDNSTLTPVELPTPAAIPVATIPEPAPHAVDSVLEDVETYVKFGRIPEAIEVLEAAVGKQPERTDLRVKLAKLYGQTSHRDGFNSQLRELTALGTAAADVEFLSTKFENLLDKAPELNDDLLDIDFNSFDSQPAPAAQPVASVAPAIAEDDFDLSSFEAELNNASTDLDTSFADIDLGEEQPQLASVETAEQPAELEFSLNDLAQEETVAPTASTDDLLNDLDQMLEQADEPVDDFSFALPEETPAPAPVVEVAPAVAEPVVEAAVQAAEPALDNFSFDSSDDFTMLEGTDVNATKLDLAQAYIDMGDNEGARDILNEVLAEGNEQQKQTAQGLITKLG